MPFDYDAALPTHTDWIRFFLGDTVADRAEISNEEIAALLSEESEPAPVIAGEVVTSVQWRAYRQIVAARCADAIAAKHARDADVSFDNQRVTMSAKFVQYRQLAKELRQEAFRGRQVWTVRV